MASSYQSKEFSDAIRFAAESLGLPNDAAEKDYYVVRALSLIKEEFDGKFLFKGGTSLSKGWGIIRRFSEDIDILFLTQEQEASLSKGELDRRMKKVESIMSSDPCFEVNVVQSSKGVHRAIELRYKAEYEPSGSIGDKILIEMGTRGGTFPISRRSIKTYLASFFEASAITSIGDDLEPFDVDCLDYRRTFVEKLFSIYAAFEEDRAARKMRHYYDLYMLADLKEIKDFIEDKDYLAVCNDVEEFSKISFPKSKTPPNLAYRSWPCLYPSKEDISTMNASYRSNRDLFFDEPPTLDDIFARLQGLLK